MHVSILFSWNIPPSPSPRVQKSFLYICVSFSVLHIGLSLRVLWSARRYGQSILKESSSEYSLEGLMLQLKLQYFGHLMQNWLIWKDPDAGKDWRWEWKDNRGWDGWMVSPTRRTWVWVNSGSWWWTGRPGVLQSMGLQRFGYWETEWNWTERFNGYQKYWLNIINDLWNINDNSYNDTSLSWWSVVEILTLTLVWSLYMV